MRTAADDPRRSQPIGEWPEVDRDRFLAATRQTDLLEEPGALAHLAPLTLDRYASAWGHCRTFLVLHGRVRPDEPLERRLTPELLADYVRDMQHRLAPKTVRHRLVGLYLVAKAIDPVRDYSWLKKMVAVVGYKMPSTRNKPAMLQPTDKLIQAGIRLMDEAEAWIGGHPRRRAAQHRNGLFVASLAARPLRRENFCGLGLDRHLRRNGGGWRIVLEADETKARNRIELPFPAELVPYLERHLEIWRPILLKGNSSNRLWISMHGRPLDSQKLYIVLGKVTTKLFGRKMTMNIFRDCLATHVAIHDPEHMGVATALLGHRRAATTERHYNLARTREAGILLQNAILELRRQAGKAG